MRCPRCLRETSDPSARCSCASVALTIPRPESALAVHAAKTHALTEGGPLTAEARLAGNVARGFRQIVESPQIARPLRLAKTYWPVAVIPSAVAVVATVGVKTSITVVGSALLWGMSIAIQLLGNM